MPRVPVRIPQIGEGLQEARLVAVLKQPGDTVRRDEAIYQMETDKAVMDVESPYAGTIVRWLADVDTVLPIGAEILEMDVADGVSAEAPAAHGTPAPPAAAPSAPASDAIPLLIPMIGEGLQEARLVAVLKQPGDLIKRDEAIYQMETDKAVMDVESPYEGTLVEWTAAVDTVLPIGAQVALMKVSGAVNVSAPAHHGPAPTVAATPSAAAPAATSGGARRTDIPPRTRAYAKEKGLTEAQLQSIPASGSKLMPADVDAFLSGGIAPAPAAAAKSAPSSAFACSEQAMPQKQRLLSSRLVRGNQLVVPGTITVATLWEGIERVSAAYKAKGGDFQPSRFTMFAYAVSEALRQFPAFRTTLVGDSVLRTFDHAHLGIAVALPGDELVLAVVDDSDKLSWPEFAAQVRAKVDLARNGQDQAHEAVTLSLTNMQAFGLRDAVPVVVPPSVATLFLGEAYNGLDQTTSELKVRRYVNLAMTFDHRLINGVGASEFINAIKSNVEGIEQLIPLD